MMEISRPMQHSSSGPAAALLPAMSMSGLHSSPDVVQQVSFSPASRRLLVISSSCGCDRWMWVTLCGFYVPFSPSRSMRCRAMASHRARRPCHHRLQWEAPRPVLLGHCQLPAMDPPKV
jgi:hypothetical protein